MAGRSEMTAAQYQAMFAPQGRTNKYHVAPPEARRYNDILYDSKAEAEYAYGLDMHLRAGLIAGWKRQVVFPLIVHGHNVGTYRADFVITHTDGTCELVEVKGYFTSSAKFKWRVFLACYQELWRAKGWVITLHYTSKRKGASA